MSEEIEHNCIDETKLSADITKFGWTVLLLEATDYLPSFGYTIGLWKNYNHPEIISFGLPVSIIHEILNIAGGLVKAGHTLEINKNYYDFFEKSNAQFLKIDRRNISDYFCYAVDFYKTEDFPALQLVWTDRNNKFPWEDSFEEKFKFRQPLLDRNAEFKFREDKYLGVFTTRQWLDLNKPILSVVHDADGDWQFLTGDQMPDDIRIVALEQMVNRDHSLNEIFNLDYGESAEREFDGGEWKRTEQKEE